MSCSDFDGDIPVPAGSWATSLVKDQASDLHRFCLPVPPSAKLPKPYHITKEGLAFPVRDDICVGWNMIGRYNNKNRRGFWRNKTFDAVVGAFRLAEQGVTPNLLGRLLLYPASSLLLLKMLLDLMTLLRRPCTT
ncbi:hypothetical protein ZWY2020_057068 [Hordeum vulgare]|nr:hypothetical protein ZWY2020_057068 [Hordeum vulgare]